MFNLPASKNDSAASKEAGSVLTSAEGTNTNAGIGLPTPASSRPSLTAEEISQYSKYAAWGGVPGFARNEDEDEDAMDTAYGEGEEVL